MKKGKWIGLAVVVVVALTLLVSAVAAPHNDAEANLTELAARTEQLRDAADCGVTLEVTADGAQLVCEEPVEWYTWYRLEQLDADGTATVLREVTADFTSVADLAPGDYRLTMLCWLPEDVTFPGILRAQTTFRK